ncbi:hypothetical protein CHARACLAT_014134 [Characodon lateralis]|uniref:Uncharacterized protein n=1 Tax=Characodon lateralis TaxID=208331 RepID=A0ABU7ECR6_9TELE|nr:hypothetical protein [Characodon lateralis]
MTSLQKRRAVKIPGCELNCDTWRSPLLPTGSECRSMEHSSLTTFVLAFSHIHLINLTCLPCISLHFLPGIPMMSCSH